MNFFQYLISLGAAVMMPILFSLLGILLGIKPGKALLSGLYVGVGFVGLSVVTQLLTSVWPAAGHLRYGMARSGCRCL